jgi:hypothetical protein
MSAPDISGNPALQTSGGDAIDDAISHDLERQKEMPMANHLTPTELAREAGLERKEVLSKCIELGVPVFHGRIDKSLFLASMREEPSPSKRPVALSS